ncbi:hypothetical protein D021_1599A, partial [Vibrio parahaemolyticus 10296]
MTVASLVPPAPP